MRSFLQLMAMSVINAWFSALLQLYMSRSLIIWSLLPPLVLILVIDIFLLIVGLLNILRTGVSSSILSSTWNILKAKGKLSLVLLLLLRLLLAILLLTSISFSLRSVNPRLSWPLYLFHNTLTPVSPLPKPAHRYTCFRYTYCFPCSVWSSYLGSEFWS